MKTALVKARVEASLKKAALVVLKKNKMTLSYFIRSNLTNLVYGGNDNNRGMNILEEHIKHNAFLLNRLKEEPNNYQFDCCDGVSNRDFFMHFHN